MCVLVFFSCNDSKETQLIKEEQIVQVGNFVEELNRSLYNLDYDFMEGAWNHEHFKSRIGKLGNTGYGVFNYIYENRIRSSILEANNDLINKVKHSGATLKHIKTNVVGDHAEVTYLLIDGIYYRFTKYRIDFEKNRPYLTDIYNFKEDRWFSKRMREIVLLNLRHTAQSTKRHDANSAFRNYQYSMENGDYVSALNALNQVPESHRIFNDYKVARINLASQLNDSLLLSTIKEESNHEGQNNIYIDYLIAFYLQDSEHKEDVDIRVRMEIGISKSLLDSLNRANLIWE